MEGNRHIAPIGWGTNYQGSAILNQGQHPLGIVFRKYAILRGAAFHAADAEADVPVLGKFDMNDCSQPGGLFFHQFKPFGNIAVPPRAAGAGLISSLSLSPWLDLSPAMNSNLRWL